MIPIGEGVFETLKVVESEPHAFTRHLERMKSSAAQLGMPIPELAAVRRSVRDYLNDQPLLLGRLRITWYATGHGAELSLAAESLSPRPASATLALDSWTVDEHGPRAGIKSTRYENFIHARQRAAASGYDDALLTNRAGNLCETSTANVFYVLEGQLHTPSASTGCLPGIARALVLDLCDVVETDAPITALAEASEVFITSSLRDVQPVRRIDDHVYPVLGPLTAEAMDAWQRLAATTWDPAPTAHEGEN